MLWESQTSAPVSGRRLEDLVRADRAARQGECKHGAEEFRISRSGHNCQRMNGLSLTVREGHGSLKMSRDADAGGCAEFE